MLIYETWNCDRTRIHLFIHVLNNFISFLDSWSRSSPPPAAPPPAAPATLFCPFPPNFELNFFFPFFLHCALFLFPTHSWEWDKPWCMVIALGSPSLKRTGFPTPSHYQMTKPPMLSGGFPANLPFAMLLFLSGWSLYSLVHTDTSNPWEDLAT